MSGAGQRLADLTAGLVAVPAELRVNDVTLDSRAVTAGSLFLACRGRTHHGLKFASEAIARGAKAVLYESSGPGEPLQPPERIAAQLGNGIFVAAVPQLSRHVGVIADRFFAAPSQALTVAGITGTNGKTTCAWLLTQALQHVNRPAAYMGTLGYGVPPKLTTTEHTTSDAVSVHRQLAELRQLGAECVCMEVSSHAVDQERVAGVRFNTAAFTNLTRDHLDYHGTMEAYGAAKARLFDWPSLANRIVNIDDPFGAKLALRTSQARLVVTSRTCGAGLGTSARAGAGSIPGADTSTIPHSGFVRAVRTVPESAGLRIAVASSWGETELKVPLVGEFNVDNVLTVLAVLLSWGIPLGRASGALEQCRAPSGRMELFGGTRAAPLAIVDYAHTPDALAKALQGARLHCRGRLRVVFGCGGDRDAGKRPLMGAIATELADEVIVTDDNPRTEDPARIVADILDGVTDKATLEVEHDRARAIALALRRSSPEDVVLIAGKGHEDYQIHGELRRAFSDQAVVSAELAGGHP
jgi:UDP-N-acetylmuramoyl-L-alanyl-D-glutamate--2,6-diaminopimelate ligase